MLIIDLKKSIPLNPSCLNWDLKHLTRNDEANTITVPICDESLLQFTSSLAYDLASHQAWLWPDMSNTTLDLIIDCSRSFFRFSLQITTLPAETACDVETGDDWEEFEQLRQNALEAHKAAGSPPATDTYAVMLTEQEENEIRVTLFELLWIF